MPRALDFEISWVKRTQREGGRASRADRAEANPVGDPLFDALRAMRRELAAEAQVPPYVIFHDAALRAMASERPGVQTKACRLIIASCAMRGSRRAV